MSDTVESTDFVSSINVRDLISAFESKSTKETYNREFSRLRAKSIGNVLSEDIIYEFNNLKEIKEAITKLETNLKLYVIYNKSVHVAFQQQLFNILTSIVNIKTDDDISERKQSLILSTQTLVLQLNKKLPSNIHEHILPVPKNQYTYTNTHFLSVPETFTNNVENSTQGDSNKNETQYVGSSNIHNTYSVNVTESVEDLGIVSVKKLIKNFQSTDFSKSNETDNSLNSKKNHISEYKFNIAPTEENKENLQDQTNQERDKVGNVSVSKLRTLFDNNSRKLAENEGNLNKNKFVFAVNNIDLPYTDRNLRNIRLQRSVSGSYMTYSGFLKHRQHVTNTVNESSDSENQNQHEQHHFITSLEEKVIDVCGV